MKNNENLLIAVLIVSAAVLIAMVVAMYSGTGQTAQAAGNFSRHWGMVGVTGQVANGVDALYMIDVDQKRMNIYVINTQRGGSIDLVQPIDLVQAFRIRR